MTETLLATTDPVGVSSSPSSLHSRFSMKPSEKSKVTTYINPKLLKSLKIRHS
jgi:hypothetical protein